MFAEVVEKDSSGLLLGCHLMVSPGDSTHFWRGWDTDISNVLVGSREANLQNLDTF